LLAAHRIGRQEELQTLLAAAGYRVTQATLSRDLKLLGVAKMPDDGGYVYRLAEGVAPAATATLGSEFANSVLAIELSGNLMIIKTQSGHGSSVAEALDRLDLPELAGTVAGDNTIFAVVREGVGRAALLAALAGTRPALTEWLA
jgi:transcriptional regulator of arginine metabolism